jgi:hypothetical protein
MKKQLFAIGLLLPFCSNAQMTLEHTYQNTAAFQTANIEGEGNKYVFFDKLNNDIKLYNEDHSLYKSIDSHLPANGTPSAVTCVSKKLFDGDDNVEVAFSYQVSGQNATVIVKDDGSIVKILSGIGFCAPKKMNSKWVIVATNASDVEIYTVPGQYLGLRPAPGSNEEAREADALLYPNPMATAATLSYTLPAKVHMATVEVYNSAGVLVRTYQVTDQFHDVLISRGELPAGNYFYTVKGFGMNSVSNKFTIQ